MDPCVVVRPPQSWVLGSDIALGGRPVDLALIGSRWEEPLDPFWQSIYRDCGVRQDHIFAMTTSVDEVRLRAYWNAGLVVVRPERGLLRAWGERFVSVLQLDTYQAFGSLGQLHRIFLHQAVLTGVVLAALRPEETQLLGEDTNYPLHLHDRYPLARRPTDISQLTSFRYEDTLDQSDWETRVPVGDPLRAWLRAQLY
jgi:hypothetical protein